MDVTFNNWRLMAIEAEGVMAVENDRPLFIADPFGCKSISSCYLHILSYKLCIYIAMALMKKTQTTLTLMSNVAPPCGTFASTSRARFPRC